LILLDMFCGSKSLEPVCDALGIEYYGIDNNREFSPNLCIDILELKTLPSYFDIIWASPPCEHFSVSSIGKHWNRDNTPKTTLAKKSMELVKHTLYLIDSANPKYFFIENPRGKLRKLDMMQNLTRRTVTYCQYGDFRMKPTDIWTNNLTWSPRPMCKNGDSCHMSAPRGSRTGTQGKMSYIEKSKIPYDLLYEILSNCIKE